MICKASALIYTREKYIGFPGGWFKVQPEDFSDSTAKLVLEYAMSAMEDVKPLRGNHEQVKVVIAEAGYVVLGIACYLRDLFSDGWEGADQMNRPVYGFFGYVWKQNDFTRDCGFPDLSEFANLAAEHIRPNWELSKNAGWATHQEAVPYHYLPGNTRNTSTDDFVPARFEDPENADRLIGYAIQRAAVGENISVCTNVTIYDRKTYQAVFQYVAENVLGKGSAAVSAMDKDGGYSQPRSSSQSTQEKSMDHAGKDGVGSRAGTADSGGWSDIAEHISQGKKADKTVPVLWLASGAGLFILTIVLIPMSGITGLLWAGVLAAAAACIVVGTVKFVKSQKQKTNKHVLDPRNIPNKQQSPSPDGVLPFKSGESTISEPLMPAVKSNRSTARAKKPEEETTEDLFKF